MPTTQKIAKGQVRDILAGLAEHGARPITVITATRKELNQKDRVTKTPNPFGPTVLKISRMNGILNFNYGNSVNSQRKREGNAEVFEAKTPKWYESIEGANGTFLKGVVKKKGSNEEYVKLKLEKVLSSAYVNDKGEKIPTADLENFLPPHKKNETQGTEKAIIPLTISLDNILSFTCNGVRYVVI